MKNEKLFHLEKEKIKNTKHKNTNPISDGNPIILFD